MKDFSFSSLSKIFLEVQDSALFVPTRRIKRQGFLSSIQHEESNDKDFSQVLAQGYVACPL